MVPWYEDEAGGRRLPHRIGALHTQLHGNGVDGETKQAEEGGRGRDRHFLLTHLRHLRDRQVGETDKTGIEGETVQSDNHIHKPLALQRNHKT